MIIGQRVQLRGPLGDVVSEQSKSTAVANLQKLMATIAALAGQADYDPSRDEPGKVGFYTASALVAMALDGVAAIPIIGDLKDAILGMVGADCIRDRMRSGITDVCNMENAWDGLKAAKPTWLRDNVINPIRSGAGSIQSTLQPVYDLLKSGGTTPTMHTVLPLTMLHFPPGTVAIRDPILGKYRLIAPPV